MEFCNKLQALFNDHKQYLSDYRFIEQNIEKENAQIRLCKLNKFEYEIDDKNEWPRSMKDLNSSNIREDLKIEKI